MFQRVLMAMSAAALTALGAQRVEAQSYFWSGCDGARSCHVISAELVFSPTNPSTLAGYLLSGRSLFVERGVYTSTGCGSGWRFSTLSNVEMHQRWGCDVNHGPSGCFYDPIAPANSNWCSGAVEWSMLFRPTPFDFAAEPAVIARFTYASTPTVVTEVRLAAVPEPATALLVGSAALALGVVSRRRRLS